MKKIVVEKEEARSRLLEGINLVGRVVGSTIGPAGKNAVLQRPGSWPLIINDGYSIAQEIHHLGDPLKDLGAEILREVAKKTNDKVGDGTTTSVVIANTLITEVMNRIKNKGELIVGSAQNVMDLCREIKSEGAKIVEKLKKLSTPVDNQDKKSMKKVAVVSLEDEELGEVIADQIYQIGKDGYILIEVGFLGHMENEVVKGMKLNVGLAARWMKTNINKNEAIFTDPVILITNHELKFSNLKKDIQPILTELINNNKKELIIIAQKFSEDFLSEVYKVAPNFRILCAKAPALDEDEFEDIAIYTGGTFVDKTKGMEIKDKFAELNLVLFGKADKIIVTEDDSYLIGKYGVPEKIEARVEEIKKALDEEKIDSLKKKKLWRMGSLASGIGIIRVGARTDFERDYKKYKIEDAIAATRAAIEEGIVKGGGLAFKELADELPAGHILKKALLAPYDKIQENAGGSLDIPEWVIDPTKVCRLAFENAISAASTFITIDSVVATEPTDLANELKKAIGNEEE